ncbi:hypothetical protein HJB86_21390 [Rhizobium sp. NZLR3b]|uniref:Abi-alpha family protein n=1 Tax=Rhizobium sp. NZLR3b TaxID=2731101 RepID=UPI001C838897|nr:hypothetical protein [Rhizobium sp. NZLR3b]MBX5191438.1 hypothetical protein [Rhizobium sp. NZLR3b]
MAEEKLTTPFEVKVDVGAKAELKAEIPAASTGRLLDALTDIIRPFSEARGLRADQIRLQREDVLIEIARKACRRFELDGTQPKPVPLRLMVPLLERASLTSPSDEVLKDAWSSLLHNTSKGAEANHGIFIDVLSKLDPVHIEFLEFLLSRDKHHPDRFLQRQQPDVEEFLFDYLSETNADAAPIAAEEQVADEMATAVQDFLTVNGCVLIAGGIHFRYRKPEDAYYEMESGIDFSRHTESIYDSLAGLNVVNRHAVRHSSENLHVWLDYCTLTVFGFEFYESCH